MNVIDLKEALARTEYSKQTSAILKALGKKKMTEEELAHLPTKISGFTIAGVNVYALTAAIVKAAASGPQEEKIKEVLTTTEAAPEKPIQKVVSTKKAKEA